MAAAIRPQSRASSTIGVKKSVVRDQGPLVVQPQHGRVVALGRPDQQVAVGAAEPLADRGHQLLQGGQGELAGAARTVGQGGQAGDVGGSHPP